MWCDLKKLFFPSVKSFSIALVADELTTKSLELDYTVHNITPYNFFYKLLFFRPDILLVESCWGGYAGSWKYCVASYPDYPKRNNLKLFKLVNFAKSLGIPCVFWNKEDGVHFDRFIDSAKFFDIVFTVDETCIPRYQQVLNPDTRLEVLPFAVQPKIHFPGNYPAKYFRVNFVGSYSQHIHAERRQWQDMMFRAAEPYGLTVFDRNSERKNANYRYPSWPWIETRCSVPYDKTADIYRDYLVSFNVNTVRNSPTMYSRRVVEILACAGIMVTNPADSIACEFSEYCDVVHSEEECAEVLKEIFADGGASRRERSRAAADYVLSKHTWEHRLRQIVEPMRLKL